MVQLQTNVQGQRQQRRGCQLQQSQRYWCCKGHSDHQTPKTWIVGAIMQHGSSYDGWLSSLQGKLRAWGLNWILWRCYNFPFDVRWLVWKCLAAINIKFLVAVFDLTTAGPHQYNVIGLVWTTVCWWSISSVLTLFTLFRSCLNLYTLSRLFRKACTFPFLSLTES